MVARNGRVVRPRVPLRRSPAIRPLTHGLRNLSTHPRRPLPPPRKLTPVHVRFQPRPHPGTTLTAARRMNPRGYGETGVAVHAPLQPIALSVNVPDAIEALSNMPVIVNAPEVTSNDPSSI